MIRRLASRWSVLATLAFTLVACSDDGSVGGTAGTGNRGGSGGAGGSGTGGASGAATGGSAGSTGGGSGVGGASGGAAGSAGTGTGGASGKGGASGSGGASGNAGAAGIATGGAAGVGGSKDAGAPDGSRGGTGGTAGAGATAGSGGTTITDARVDGIDAPTGTGGAAGSGTSDAAPPTCSPLRSTFAPISVTVPPKGTATSLDVGAWNIEWFGDTANGPSDENLQRDNVGDVLQGTDLDIWGLEEVVSAAQFNQVLARLPGYKGFLSDDPLVEQGSSWYTATEQKLGLVYKCSVATVQKARVILTNANTAFAGRPPLEVTLRVTLNGVTDDLVVIVMHGKAYDDVASWQRRKDASDALKPYLDSTYPTQKVIVVGDYNDDVDTSITAGQASPYANFVNDTANYTFITKVLTDNGTASTTGFPDMIDHHMATNELAAKFIAGSVEVYKLETIVTNYASTTTDHYPVLSRYNVGP